MSLKAPGLYFLRPNGVQSMKSGNQNILESIKNMFARKGTCNTENGAATKDLSESQEVTLQRLSKTAQTPDPTGVPGQNNAVKPSNPASINKRPSSTHIRLQALSASGTGSASSAPAAAESEKLSSILNRLDG